MNFGTIIWGSLSSAVPDLVVCFTLFGVFDIIRSMLFGKV